MTFKESKPGCPARLTTTTSIFAVYFTTLLVTNLHDVVWQGDELERIWKEAVMA
jgi:hypothetical protein